MEKKRVEIRGKGLYVELHGKRANPPLLYLHGGPGEGCSDFTTFQAQYLASSVYLIALDQRGVCRSDQIEESEPFGLDDLIEDIEGLREMLEIEKWSVLGHSFGGYLALLYAISYPHAVEKVIFETPTFDFKLTSISLLKKTAQLAMKQGNTALYEACHALVEQDEDTLTLFDGYERLSQLLGEERITIYTPNETPYEDLYKDEIWEEYFNRSEIHFNRLREEGKVFTSLLPQLKALTQPSLLILGGHDPVTCPDQVDTYLREAVLGKQVLFENCGHTPHYEEPESFSRLVISFLQEKSEVS